ncbi:MAG: hypothetical protein ACI9MR_000360 [Myxococcota bacterium]
MRLTLARYILCTAGLCTVLVGCGDSDSGSGSDTTVEQDSGASDSNAIDTVTDTAIETDSQEPPNDTAQETFDFDATVPGGFASPCVENLDCDSGWCIDSDKGTVCTRTCDEDCPGDWRCKGVESAGGDFSFVCVPDQSRLCQPCTVDLQCAGGFCLAFGDGSGCSRPCADDDPCPTGYACTDQTSTETGVTSQMCSPTTNVCDCTASNSGDQRPCPTENEFGRCWGFQTCDGFGGWSACDAQTPSLEVCDGADNDCDNISDELVDPPDEACVNENPWGQCDGGWRCGGNDGWLCSAPTPAEDVCDFGDNDCDGIADDSFRDPETGLYIDDDHCGTCNNSCAGKIAFATSATCAVIGGAPSCVATACEAGFYLPSDGPSVCLPLGGGVECAPCLGDQSCSDLDGGACQQLDDGRYCTRGCATADDCEVGLDCLDARCVPRSGSCACLASNAGNTRPCAATNTLGTCFGVQTCDPDASPGWTTCSAPEPSEEICDGLDNDCDGLVDELVNHAPANCEVDNAFGTCTAPWICNGVNGWVCEALTPTEEVCDYRDNNCSDAVDDGFVDATTGQYFGNDHCGACGIACEGALPNATAGCAQTDSGVRCEVTSCDPGFFQSSPLACLPASTDNCIPCEQNANCPGGHCVDLGEGSYCLNPCQGDENCLPGYSCIAGTDGANVCTPDTGSCQCDGSNLNLLKGCDDTFTPTDGAPAYACLGTQRCTTSGWDMCLLGEEECNLLDDDCDGQVDEDFLVDGEFASDEHCGQCGNDCTLLTFAGGGGVCNTTVSPPVCSLTCSGSCFDVNANPNDGCECCDPTPVDFPDDEGTDANCDGTDGERDNAIFVSKDGNDANTGVWGAPKLTIQAGIDAAVVEGKRDVYVATGIYGEAITLVENVAVYGGYASNYANRNGVLYESAILAPAPTVARPGAVNAVGLLGGNTGGARLDGFSVYGFSARAEAGVSYAVYIRNSDETLAITSNRIIGGSGGKGRRGGDGSDGANGGSGGGGVDALDLLTTLGVDEHDCAAEGIVSDGGAAGAGLCGGTLSTGGKGGDRGCPTFDGDFTGTPRAIEGGVSAPGGATGGSAGQDVYHQSFSCSGYVTFGDVQGGNGADGSAGTDGTSGGGCDLADGMVTGGLWVGDSAAGGGSGSVGAGGGGGGSGGGAYVHNSCFSKGFGYDNLGGTGGGGGAPGCMGTGGEGGTAGGGAFAIFVTFDNAPSTAPEFARNTITPGFGGDGGDGGNAGVGGSGGAGGFGGAGGGGYEPPEPTYPSFEGGRGGNGGLGGHGGGGGGGCGGPAYGIFANGEGGLDLSAWIDDNTIVDGGGPGAPGRGGFSLGLPGGEGKTATSAATNF